ncbi:MAG TPA: fluoride efflux transporter CrcB [Streptosporangiales bacterium]
MSALLAVLLGGAVGAPLRYVTDRVVQSRHDQVFPWGTLTVNVTGSLVLGVMLGLSAAHVLPAWAFALAGTGFCGALTTFSTFSFETLRLLEEGSPLEAAGNVVVSLAAGLAAATAGFYVVSWLA